MSGLCDEPKPPTTLATMHSSPPVGVYGQTPALPLATCDWQGFICRG